MKPSIVLTVLSLCVVDCLLAGAAPVRNHQLTDTITSPLSTSALNTVLASSSSTSTSAPEDVATISARFGARPEAATYGNGAPDPSDMPGGTNIQNLWP